LQRIFAVVAGDLEKNDTIPAEETSDGAGSSYVIRAYPCHYDSDPRRL
jgi:hypothetical protein